MRAKLRTLALFLLVLLPLVGCKTLDRGVVYTENGLTAAADSWDYDYRALALECQDKHKPKTPEMEACFGARYDADAKLKKVLEWAVEILRDYWRARAAGENPSFDNIMAQIKDAIEGLPPEVRQYFERVQGLGS